MRDRLFVPVLLPLLAAGGILLTIFSFGYVLLQVQETRAAWPVAIIVAGSILLIAALVAGQPNLRGWPLYALTALPASVILGLGLFYLIQPAPETSGEGGLVEAAVAPPGPLNEIATDNKFATTAWTIVAGQQYTFTLANQGVALHNWQVNGVQNSNGQPIATKLLPGGQSETIEFTIPQAGSFDFLCQVHPTEMQGKLTVVAEGAATGGTGAAAGSGGAGSPGPGSITQVTTDNKFSQTQLNANANEQTSLTLDNRGSAIHNWHVTGVNGSDGKPIQTTLLPGGKSETIQFTIATAGTYNFLCDVHPTEMTGKVTVK